MGAEEAVNYQRQNTSKMPANLIVYPNMHTPQLPGNLDVGKKTCWTEGVIKLVRIVVYSRTHIHGTLFFDVGRTFQNVEHTHL